MNEKKFHGGLRLDEILRMEPKALLVFSKHLLDLGCCNPSQTSLELACQDQGIEMSAVLSDLNDVTLKRDEREKPKKITEDMTMESIVDFFPETVAIIMEYGLHCVGCHVSTFETLREGAAAHGMSEEEVAELVSDLNDAISEKGKES